MPESEKIITGEPMTDSELSIAVAEKVMGWEWFTIYGRSYIVPPHGVDWFKKATWTAKPGKLAEPESILNLGKNYAGMEVPNYSTDWNDAMKVVAKLRENPDQFEKFGCAIAYIATGREPGGDSERASVVQCVFIAMTPKLICEAALSSVTQAGSDSRLDPSLGNPPSVADPNKEQENVDE